MSRWSRNAFGALEPVLERPACCLASGDRGCVTPGTGSALRKAFSEHPNALVLDNPGMFTSQALSPRNVSSTAERIGVNPAHPGPLHISTK
jgi:hypothetical protein